MSRRGLYLLSLAGRVANSARNNTSSTKAVKAVTSFSRAASSSSSSSSNQRNHASSSSSSSSSSRSITTQTKSTGPAQPMAKRERDSQKYIIESELEDLPIPQITMHEYAQQDWSKWADKTALECGLTGRKYTYGQLSDGVKRFSAVIQKLEVMKGAGEMAREKGKGPTTALLLPNCPEYPIAYFGCMAAGGTVTTVNPAFTPEEVAWQFKGSDTTVIVVDSLLEPLANAAIEILGKEDKKRVENMSVLVSGVSKSGRPNLREIIADPNVPFADAVEVPLESTCAMPYSSGTTGLPKGVCLPHLAFTNTLNCFHQPAYCSLTAAEGESQEVLLGLLPFYHIYGMAVIMMSGLMHGVKIVTMPNFDPKAYLNILAKHKVSTLHLVPPLLNFMATNPAVNASALSSLKAIYSSAAPISLATVGLLKNKAEQDIEFLEGYGLTETTGTHFTPRGRGRIGGCLVLQNVKSKVVDVETRENLPPGQIGELCLLRPAMMTSYYNNEKATAEAFDEEGYFKTGDVGMYDEERFFTVVDRIKELIKVKGIQVSPSEIEDVLRSHPGVADVGVVGVPNEKSGEVPRAYVVPQSKDVKGEELQAFVASKLARHKHLIGGVEFVEELPKNPTGKLLRRELKKVASRE